MKILLVGPCSADDVFNSTFRDIPYIRYMTNRKSVASTAPHALATIAALTPAEHEVSIHDEHLHGPVEPLLGKNHYDIIGISLITNQINRTFEIARFCKEKNLPGAVVLGGAGTAMIPQGLDRIADVIFCGEAEDTWPQFLKEFKAGNHKRRYQQISKPDGSKFPIPRWDLIREDLPAYGVAAVQTARGCPFDCAFCDVTYIYGRKVRHKPVDQTLEEIRILESMEVKSIFITDDNFACDKRRAKKLLRELVRLNNSFDVPIGFITQADITIADDDQLLELMADCNFGGVLIGIESLSKESLKDLNKSQNIRRNLREAVQRIQSYGITVLASMIIGADSDDKSAFQKTEDFLKEVNIISHECHPLMAPFGTKLWYQLKRKGRLVKLGAEVRDRLDILTNIVPKQMTRVELMEGLADYWETVFHPLHYMERAIGYIKGIRRKPNVKKPKWASMWKYGKIMFRIFWYYLFEVTPDHRKAFFRTLITARRTAPYLVPQMIFLHTCYMMAHKRAMIAAKLAREQAAWEQSHPEALRSVDRSLPIPLKVRESAPEIFAAAHARVHEKVSERENLYKVVVEAMIDYVERFGGSFERFDEYHLDYVNESCDRILAHISPSQSGETSALPEEPPPAGFEREILDALDHAIRFRECVRT